MTEPSLRERLIALVNEAPSLLISGVRVPMVVSWPDAMTCRETIALAAARMALEEAAKLCEDSWRSGYRGEVTVGFAYVIRSLAEVTCS